MIKSSQNKPWLFSAGLIFFIFLNRHFFFFTPTIFEQISSYLLYPLLMAQQKVVEPMKSWLEKRRAHVALEKKYNDLRGERDQLIAQIAELHATIDYAHDIQEIVDFKRRYNASYLKLVHIILKHLSNQAHYFLLDRGARHGVQPDMVAVYKNCLIGRIIEVYPYYSKLLLVTDRSCKVAVRCTNTKVEAIHEGVNDIYQTSLQHVSHLVNLELNDLIISSGQGLVFPRGFALGRIISYKPNGLYFTVDVKPLVDLHDLSYCYLITKGAEVSMFAKTDQD